MAERPVRYHQQLQRPRALDVLSCEDISSSSDSSDSSNDDAKARHVHAEGSHLNPPMSYSVLGVTENSDDSNSQPFEVSNLSEVTEPEKPAERTTSGTRSCFYGLSDNCMDHQDHEDLGVPGFLKYMIDTAILLAGFIHGNLNVLTDFKSRLVLVFAAVTLTLSLYSVQAPLVVCLCLIAISSAYAVQHNILLRRVTHTPLDSNLYQQTFQRFISRYSTRSQLHNVFPCSNCQDQFQQTGIFEFHNSVASRLNKAHICSPPYSGYDYLVAYLLWGMDRAMVESSGHGFLSARCDEPHRPDSDNNFLHDSTRIYADHFLRGAESAARHWNQSNDANAATSEVNQNNANSNMDYRPDSGDATSDDYNSPSQSSSDSSDSSGSNTSMEYLALSQESTESEGYHTAMNQHSPTTSMNVHFVNNDDAATSTEVEDYNTFSMYTSHSSNTDSYEDEEEGDDNDSETADDFTTASRYSPNASLRCTSPNGSEDTLQGSENDTTKSQCGSELTKDETVATKSEPRNSQSQSKAPKPTKDAVGDNVMVDQLISGTVQEHLGTNKETDSSQVGSEANESSTKANVDCTEAKSVTCSPSSEAASGFQNVSNSNNTSPTRTHTKILPRSPVEKGQDPLNRNNNGNTLIRSKSKTNYKIIDVEANIEDISCYCDTPDSDIGEGCDGVTYVPPRVPPNLREDSDIELEITYAESAGSLDSDVEPLEEDDASSGTVSSDDDQYSSDDSDLDNEEDRFVVMPYDRGDAGDIGTTGEDRSSSTHDPESLPEPGMLAGKSNKPRKCIPAGAPAVVYPQIVYPPAGAAYPPIVYPTTGTVYPHDIHMAEQDDRQVTGRRQQDNNVTVTSDGRWRMTFPNAADHMRTQNAVAAHGQNWNASWQ